MFLWNFFCAFWQGVRSLNMGGGMEEGQKPRGTQFEQLANWVHRNNFVTVKNINKQQTHINDKQKNRQQFCFAVVLNGGVARKFFGGTIGLM